MYPKSRNARFVMLKNEGWKTEDAHAQDVNRTSERNGFISKK